MRPVLVYRLRIPLLVDYFNVFLVFQQERTSLAFSSQSNTIHIGIELYKDIYQILLATKFCCFSIVFNSCDMVSQISSTYCFRCSNFSPS